MFDEQRFREVLREEIRAALAEQHPAISPEAYMTQAEAAKYANVTPSTIRKWHAQGLAVQKVGRSRRYTKSALDAFLKTPTTPATFAEMTWNS